MDRDGFPTLTEGATGWPRLSVPWSGGAVAVEVCEDVEVGSTAVVSVEAPCGVRVFVGGVEWGPK